MKAKTRIFAVLEAPLPGDRGARVLQMSITVLILLNVVAVAAGTVHGVVAGHHRLLWRFEVFSVVVFTIEYVLRMWSCTGEARFRGPIAGRVRFALTPMALVDLAAILPFYLPSVMPLDLRFVRALRLFRLVRIFKLGKYSESLNVLGQVVRAKKEELLVSLAGVLTVLVVASGLIFYIEHKAQPQAFSSIPASLWWTMATLSTVGYGDMYPITSAGKLVAGVIQLLGIAACALPAGIFASGFVEHMQQRRTKPVCPHCGRAIELDVKANPPKPLPNEREWETH